MKIMKRKSEYLETLKRRNPVKCWCIPVVLNWNTYYLSQNRTRPTFWDFMICPVLCTCFFEISLPFQSWQIILIWNSVTLQYFIGEFGICDMKVLNFLALNVAYKVQLLRAFQGLFLKLPGGLDMSLATVIISLSFRRI